ncbi:MAG: adenylosuccinate synthase [Polyangiaceae bacterium]|nr:adenylosuccinate synthase [Polyangiaceae bacterium]
MSSVVVVGAQWGDEGKGKIVDLYTEFADVVVRYAGGPNAGHTLVVGDEKLIVRLLPSGILRAATRCVLGQGMVVDPSVLVAEIDGLIQRGHTPVEGRLSVSDRAHLILPYHIVLDTLREDAAGLGRALGTTKKGIGPAYEDKARRTGVRTGDLRDPRRLLERVETALKAWAPVATALGGRLPGAHAIVDGLAPLAERIVPLLANTSVLVAQAMAGGKNVMFEGAQGTLLDVDHGTYPFVTSSSATAGGAAVGCGVGPNKLDRVVGITKAYTTRVGAGPFPTELTDSDGAHLREIGAEFGSVTGRPRRTGWVDLPALRYAARINGLDGLALTKLDVLTGLDRVRVCVAYDTPSGRSDELPDLWFDEPDSVTPVYETLDGWTEKLTQARALEELPPAARAYVAFLEQGIGVPVYVLSVGARRSETIVMTNPFAPNG